jgi:hypothetical protein
VTHLQSAAPAVLNLIRDPRPGARRPPRQGRAKRTLVVMVTPALCGPPARHGAAGARPGALKYTRTHT